MSEENLELGSNDEGQSQQESEVERKDRLLEESKRNKERFQAANAQLKSVTAQLKELEAFKNSKLTEEGNYKVLLEKANEKLKKIEEDSAELRRKTLRSNILSTLSRLAPDAHDVEILMTQKKHKHLLDAGLDEDTLSLRDEDGLNFLNAVFQEKPFLRKTNPTIFTHKGGKPAYVEKEVKEKTYAEMNAQEKEEFKIKLMLEKSTPSKN